MIRHYFKIAFRNLWKYRLQNIISILGLSLGFTCFALSMLWIRYELTYDHFHEGADRLFQVYVKHPIDKEINSYVPYLTASYMKEKYPEVEQVCLGSVSRWRYKSEGGIVSADLAYADSAFMSFFGVRILSGTDDFLRVGGKDIAVTEEFARRIWPGQNPLGKELEDENHTRKRVCAVVTDWSRHSNLHYEIVGPLRDKNDHWLIFTSQCFIRLKEGTDIQAFVEKVEAEPKKSGSLDLEWVLVPIQSVRYLYLQEDPVVKLTHVKLFALAGGLVVLCSLLNYLGLFVSHLRIRTREIALRILCGASGGKLWKMLAVEFLLLLGVAVCGGMVLIELLLPSFRELAEIEISTRSIYVELLLYLSGVVLLAALFAAGTIYHYRRRVLKNSLNEAQAPGRNFFRKGCILVQLIISLGFIYCTVVLMNQVYYLTHRDIGFARENRGVVTLVDKATVKPLATRLRQLPLLGEVQANYASLVASQGGSFYYAFNDWEGKSGTPDIERCRIIPGSREFLEFYELVLLEGVIPEFDVQQNKAIANETFAKALKVPHPLGLHVRCVHEGDVSCDFEIVGIVKDFSYLSPTLPVKPVLIALPEGPESKGELKEMSTDMGEILFKFQPGTWAECKKEIEAILRTEFPDLFSVEVINMDEGYREYIKSERTLLHLLGVASGACILISLFGVYSLVMLSCEQRRKEIAIRKVNGASVWSILRIFFREYMLLLGIAALIAFPVGYFVMQNWLDNYINQAEIGYWVYLSILLGVAVAIGISVGWRVWRAANQNPAEVIKSE